jgi:hypothetical protein
MQYIHCPEGFQVAFKVSWTHDLGDYHQALYASNYIIRLSMDGAVQTYNGLLADNEFLTHPKQDICIQPVFVPIPQN